ncbi:putative transcriptional regulator [Ochrobactrum sp. P20RRXII]|nr:hypothetical protein [Ochrobactrum sp. P20RRXII]NIH77361.1 putative transcriptional regulator [Ochrobactrum sp. P20RRXII]
MTELKNAAWVRPSELQNLESSGFGTIWPTDIEGSHGTTGHYLPLVTRESAEKYAADQVRAALSHPAPAVTDTGLELDIDATAENIACHLSNYKNSGRIHVPTYQGAKAGALMALQCVAPVTRECGELVTVLIQKRCTKLVNGHWGSAYLPVDQPFDLISTDAETGKQYEYRALVTRQQAVELFAAERAEKEEWRKRYHATHERLLETDEKLHTLEAQLATANADAQGYKSTIQHLTKRAETAEATIVTLSGRLTDISGKIGAFHDADNEDAEMHILDDIQTIILTATEEKNRG